MEDVFFDIRAKAPIGATKEDLSPMLQALLAERFKLKIRREPREIKGYVLTLGKGASRMQESPKIEPGAPAAPSNTKGPRFNLDKDGFIIAPPGTTNMMTMPGKDGVSRLTAARASMGMLCTYLGRQLQEPVVNQTGLTGLYDFRLAYAPDVASPGSAGPPQGAEGFASEPAPILLKAVESQLGLKLESKKVHFEILVIGYVERTPIEN